MNIFKALTSARKKGNFGEKAAAAFLKKKGYKLLERNYVALNEEIDLIARKDGVTVFVEVKTRTLGRQEPSEPRPASSVTPKKQRGIIIAAKTYLTTHGITGRSRFDVIEVLLEDTEKPRVLEVHHLENTFNRDTAFKRR